MSDLLSRLEKHVMPSQDVLICLDMNLLAERDAAVKALTASQVKDRARRRVEDERMTQPGPVDSDETAALQDRVGELEQAIRGASFTLRVRGVDRLTYQEWVLACPPPKGKEQLGIDPAKFYMHAAKNSAVYVDAEGAEHPISDDEWAKIDTALTNGEYDRLAQAVNQVNVNSGRVDVAPFVNGSETTKDSFGISVSPARSGSRRAASGAGSRPKSTKSTSTRKGAAASE